MAILNIVTTQTGLVGVLPSLAYLETTDSVASVTTTGYLNHAVETGYQFTLPCMACIITRETPSSAPVVGWYQIVHASGNWSAVAVGGSSGGDVTKAEVQQSAFNHGTDTGTSTAYEVTLSPAIASYTDGLLVSFTPANTNTDTACTLNINGIGAQGIIINAGTSFLSLGDLNNSFEAQLIYSEVTQQFILLNPQVSIPVLRDMVTGNSYWAGVDQGVSADAYGLDLGANTASGSNQFNPVFAVLQFPNATNTGPSTLTFTNGEPFAILDSKGNALMGGEIVAFKTAFMVFDGASSYLLMNSAI